MATLISGQINYDDNGQPDGIVFTYRVEFQQRSGFLTQAQVEGLSLPEIKALAQSIADADTGLVGNPYLFNMSNEATIDFDNLPGWASWTGQEAEDFVHNLIFGGQDEATLHAQIDSQVTNVATIKIALKQTISEILAVRAILEKEARAIMYLRDF